MATSINKLSGTDFVTKDDLLPLWVELQGDTRKVSIATLIKFLEITPNTENLLTNLDNAITTAQLDLFLTNAINQVSTNTSAITQESSDRAAAIAAEAAARVTATSTSNLLTELAGAITASELASALATPIGNLPTNTTAEIASLQSQVNTLTTADPWSSATTYSIDDLATYNGNLYRSKTNSNTNNQPSGTTADTADWAFVGVYSSLSAAVAGNTSDITQINFIDATSTSAAAANISSLNSTVNDPTTGLVATRATLLNDYYTQASTDSAIATATTGLVSTSALNTALADYTTTASLTQNYYTKTATDSAISSATTDLVSNTSLNSTLGNYVTNSTLTNNYYTQTATNSAISSATTGLVSTSGLNTALADYTTTATLTSNYYTQTATDSAISSATSTLVTDIANNTTTIQTNASSINGLEGQYSVKIDVNGRVAGFGLSNTSSQAGGSTSEFAVLADKFSIVSTANNNTLITPFIVQTQNTTIGGETVPAGVYMDTAYIRNGTINNVKIADAAIDNAKILNLDAGKINAGTIDTARLNIDGSTLTSSGGVLQVGNINASAITAGSIATNVMSGTTVYANKLLGDVNTFLPFRSQDNITWNTSERTLIEITLPATSHLTEGHIPFATATGYFDSKSNRVYTFRMYMRNTVSQGSTNIGTPITSGFLGSFDTLEYYYVRFSGDVTQNVSLGSTLTQGVKTAQVETASYDPTLNRTNITYIGSSAFSTSSSVTASGNTNYSIVGSSRSFPNSNYAASFALSGSLASKTTSSSQMKVTVQRYNSNGTSPDTSTELDTLGEISGIMMGVR